MYTESSLMIDSNMAKPSLIINLVILFFVGSSGLLVKRSCEQLVVPSENLAGADELILKSSNFSRGPTNLPDDCLIALQDPKLQHLKKLEIHYFKLNRIQIYLILTNKDKLLELVLAHNFLKEFLLECLDSTPLLRSLTIKHNSGVQITGKSKTTRSIVEFNGNGNDFERFPLDNNWPNLVKISLPKNDDLRWNTTFRLAEYPLLETINGMDVDEFLASVYYLQQDEEEPKPTTDYLSLQNINVQEVTRTPEPPKTAIFSMILTIAIVSVVIAILYTLKRILLKKQIPSLTQGYRVPHDR